MLRFLLLVTCCLLGVFTGIGTALSREWGWSEYASDELYVLYHNRIPGNLQYFIVKVGDDPHEGEPLNWQDGGINVPKCSPDGRTLAFRAPVGQVIIMTEAGIVDDRFETWRSLDISSQGLILQSENPGSISVLAPDTGEVLLSLPHAGNGRWLAAGEILTYFSAVRPSDNEPGWYLADVKTGVTLHINDWLQGMPMSPDGTKAVGYVVADGQRTGEQLYIFNPVAADEGYLLTFNLDANHFPVCFLTFRPQMLIAASP